MVILNNTSVFDCAFMHELAELRRCVRRFHDRVNAHCPIGEPVVIDHSPWARHRDKQIALYASRSFREGPMKRSG